MTRIAVVEGDGIGHEVIPVAQKALFLLHPEYEYFPVEVGYGRWEETGCPCGDADISALKTCRCNPLWGNNHPADEGLPERCPADKKGA